MVSYRPYLQEIQRARRQGNRDYNQSMARVGSVYGALGRELGGVGGIDTGAIGQQFTSQLGGLADMLGSSVPGVPAGEISAGTGVFGAIGAGGLSQLASDASRSQAYQSSAQRQGSIESMIAQRNMTQDRLGFLDDLRQQRLDTMSRVPAEIRSRIDALRDLMFSQGLQNRQFGLQNRSYLDQQRLDQLIAEYYGGMQAPGFHG